MLSVLLGAAHQLISLRTLIRFTYRSVAYVCRLDFGWHSLWEIELLDVSSYTCHSLAHATGWLLKRWRGRTGNFEPFYADGRYGGFGLGSSTPFRVRQIPTEKRDPTITMTPTPAGVIAHVSWVHPPGMSVAGYDIYYRKQPAQNQAQQSPVRRNLLRRVCFRRLHFRRTKLMFFRGKQTVEAPAATITGLEPNTRYSFAIRAFNESESLCSK